jgi:hypothetical protein
MPPETFTSGEYDYLGSAIIAIAFRPTSGRQAALLDRCYRARFR